MTAAVLVIGVEVAAQARIEMAAARAAQGAQPPLEPPRVVACAPEHALECIAEMRTGVGAVLLGTEIEAPLSLAQHISRHDDDIAIVMLAPPGELDELLQRTLLTPFLGPQVRCRASDAVENIAEELVTLAHASEVRRRHRATLASVGPLGLTASRSPVVNYWDRLVEQAPLGIALLDQDGTILASNARMAGMLEHASTALVGLALTSVVTSDDAARWHKLVGTPLQPGETRRARLALQTRHGERFLDATLVEAKPGQADEHGARSLLLLADITERVQAEEDVRVAKERLELALAAGHMGIWDWDLRSGRMASWSPEMYALHGVAPDESSVGLDDYLARVHPDDRERVAETLKTSAASGARDIRIEYRIVRPDGSTRWLESRGRISHDRAGAPRRIRGVMLDVTERQEATLAVVRSEAFHAATLMSVGDAVVAVDDHGDISLMNAVAERLTGWTLDEVRGRRADDVVVLLDEHTRESVESPIARVLRTRTACSLPEPLLLRRSDEIEVSIADSAAPIRTRDGDTLGAVMVFRDVTQRRREELWSSLLVTAREAIVDPEAIEPTLNELAHEAIAGLCDWCVAHVVDGDAGSRATTVSCHRDEALDEVLSRALEHLLPGAQRGPFAALGEVTEQGGARLASVVSEAQLLEACGDDAAAAARLRELGLCSWLVVAIGRERPAGAMLLASRSLQRFSGADLAHARRVGEDLGAAIERARAEAERERLLEELRRAVHFSQLFVGVLGHDLRNPLNAIMTSAQLMAMRAQRGASDSDAGAAAARSPESRIIRSGQRMARMIEQLLDLTRVRLGEGIPLAPSELDLEALCRQVLDELLVAHPGWRLELEVEGDLRGQWDGDRIAQVISNLGGNAIEHGDPQLPLHVRLDGRSPERVGLSIQNAGVIPEELLPHIFDPFRRARLRSKGSAGLGLGLFITRQIVEAHGGSVHVVSSQEGGTIFTVVLPRAPRGTDA